MTAKPKTVPELRFPGFDEKWRETPLGKLADLYQPKTISQTDLTAEGYTVYGANGIIGKYHSFNHEMPQIAVTCRGSTCGLVNFTEPHSWITGNAMVVNLDERPKETKRFVYYALNATDLRYLITGSGQPQITGNLKGHEIGVPSLLEQRKIANFLTAVDGRIGQLSQKKALLEDYKKGVMQQLFTQALRFKDDHGNDFPEWEEKTLGEVLTIGSGRDYKHLGKGNIPVYGSGGVMTFVDASLYEGESVCIGRKGTIDKPRFVEGAFWTVDTLFYTHSFKRVLPRFIYAVFQQINWKTYNEASGVPSLSKSTIESIPVSFPSIPEQTKIANFLTALDRKIESVAQQIRHTQAFKKGLLQQMFV